MIVIDNPMLGEGCDIQCHLSKLRDRKICVNRTGCAGLICMVYLLHVPGITYSPDPHSCALSRGLASGVERELALLHHRSNREVRGQVKVIIGMPLPGTFQTYPNPVGPTIIRLMSPNRYVLCGGNRFLQDRTTSFTCGPGAPGTH